MQFYVFEPRQETRARLERLCARGRIRPVFIADHLLSGSASFLASPESRGRALLLADLPETAERLRALRACGHENPMIVLRDVSGGDAAADLLDAGADDVMVAPLHAAEFAARVRRIDRHRHGHAGEAVEVGAIRAYLDARDPEVAGRPVALTRREQEILRHLAMQVNRMVTKDALYAALYGLEDAPPLNKVIEVHICTLRKKLAAAAPDGCSHIATVKRRGYRFGLPA